MMMLMAPKSVILSNVPSKIPLGPSGVDVEFPLEARPGVRMSSTPPPCP
jgi:hypothetical protein